MGFGEYDGALDSAKKGIRKFAGCRSLLPGELSRDGLKFCPRSRPRPPGTCPRRLSACGDSSRRVPARRHPQGTRHSKASESTSPNARERQTPFQQDPQFGRKVRPPASARFAERPLQNRETQLLLRIKKIIKASFGQRGLLTNRIHSRGCIATGQEQFFRCGQETFCGLIGCHFNRTLYRLVGIVNESNHFEISTIPNRGPFSMMLRWDREEGWGTGGTSTD